MSTTAYIDACPECPPGLPDASPALGTQVTADGVPVTDHECGLCGLRWTAEWVAGWVSARTTVPDRDRDREVAAA